MKYGLVVFKKTRNIGDDIQSYAVRRFLPKVDYYIEREKLNEFKPQENKKVKCILSGWYLYNLYTLPPSLYIDPLIISIHLTDEIKNRKPIYFTDYFLNYLKKYEPIGLRDSLVKKYLDDENIKNYFSGCLTLTLEKFVNITKTDNIYAVDLDKENLDYLKKISNFKIIEKSHDLTIENEKLSYEERFNNVEELLKEYQSAKLVITSRLHCALPCLSLGVPVLFIYNKENKDVKNRLCDYVENGFLNTINKNEFKKKIKKYLDDIPANPETYKKIRRSLINNKVNNFILNEEISNEDKLDLKLYEEYFFKPYNNAMLIRDTIKEQMILDFEKEKLQLEKIINELRKDNDYFIKENDKLCKDNYELKYKIDLIENSRGYKWLEKIRKLKNKGKNK